MADSGIGSPQDSKATDTTGSWSIIALLKKLIDITTSGSTVTASGTLGIDQTTPGTTDSVTVKASAGIGSLTESAPASDTASSGLNGRLQRIAQNITTLMGVASGATDSGNPVKVGGKYNSTKPTLTTGQRGDLQLEIGGQVANSLYAQVTNPGDTALQALSSGGIVSLKMTPYSGQSHVISDSAAVADTQSGANTFAANNGLYNGGSWDRQRANTSNTVLASAARTSTTNADFTNYNGRFCIVFLNITVAPNTAGTLTLAIREKDSISANYVSVLTGAAILGSASQSVPVTNRYVVALGVTVAANLDVSDALGRTLNVIVTHSTADSWTYSVSADLGV